MFWSVVRRVYHNSGAAGKEAVAADDLSLAYEADLRNASVGLSELDVVASQESNLRWNWAEDILAAGKPSLQEKQKGLAKLIPAQADQERARNSIWSRMTRAEGAA